jgi:ketosteroid isomerase-like protein
MRNWLATRLVSKTMAALRQGDYGPTLRLDADNVALHFPGDSSWAGEFSGKEAHGDWLARFVQIGLQIHPDEVVVSGWRPWHLTIATRGHVFLNDSAGAQVYDNRFVLWGVLRWGHLADYEVYEDTQKSAALDRYLEAKESAA